MNVPTAPCPVCGQEIRLYESMTFDGDERSWWGTCGQCGSQVEGPDPTTVQVTQREPREEMGWEKRRHRGYGRQSRRRQ